MQKKILALSLYTLTLVGMALFSHARAETIGGWALSSSTLTGGDVTLSSGGDITVGTGNNVARLSDGGSYRLWVGHATASSAPFRVELDGDVHVGDIRITGGGILIGSTNRIWLNDGGDGVLAVGGSVKASAPFFIQANGTSTIDNLTSDTFSVEIGEIYDLLSTNSQRFSNLAGGGTRNLCIDNAGNVFAAASC